MSENTIETLSVSEAISACRVRYRDFLRSSHRIEGILSVTGYGACLRDFENEQLYIHIPGSWIYHSVPHDMQQYIGSLILYSGNGAVTGKLHYGGLGLAECAMFAIDSFEFNDSKTELVEFGPFVEKIEVELLGRFGRNAVLRWLGDEESPMITLDIHTLHSIKQQVDRINDPQYQNDERGTPAERVGIKFNLFFERLIDTLNKHELWPPDENSAG